MSDTVIRVENLGKRYIIGHQQQEKYTALRDVLANQAKAITQRFNPKARLRQAQSPIQNPNLEDFWALKDVSFEVKRGDRIGIIGRNGAGKSTLLKILSRITEPTTGRISIKGRVASLLEVGTGFHPELTGRENIYLNGAILGMSRVEIKKKFDEIVAFSEVERFLDTPVKRYSSGMYVRLAFAVAAHLEPEILVVDEVLAVGDVAFQKKCLGKMEDVAEQDGRTVLFVSHNMQAIQSLCKSCIFLRDGLVQEIGSTDTTISAYISQFDNIQSARYVNTGEGKEDCFLLEASIFNSRKEPSSKLYFGEPFTISMTWKHRIKISGLAYGIRIYEQMETFITAANSLGSELELGKEGVITTRCEFSLNVLSPGIYRVFIGAFTKPYTSISPITHYLTFEIESLSFKEDFRFKFSNHKKKPLVSIPDFWHSP